jgi:hypothetical protein
LQGRAAGSLGGIFRKNEVTTTPRRNHEGQAQTDSKEAHTMISRTPQKSSDWLIAASLVTIVGVPPKDPPDDDDENEEDEDDDEDDEEPAVIREPDEC